MNELSRVHPELIYLMYLSLQETPYDFAIIDGARTFAEQRTYFDNGASSTLKSRHLLQKPIGLEIEYSHAVDIACYLNGKIRWEWNLYEDNAKVIKKIAKEYGIDIEWGGDWITLRDGPHFQLSWSSYPVQSAGV